MPSGDGRTLEVDGQQRGDFDSQDEAIQHGRQLAEEQNSELVIQSQEGKIREKDSHRDDPRDIPG